MLGQLAAEHRPGGPGGARSGPRRSCATPLALPVHDRALVRPGRPAARRLAGGRRRRIARMPESTEQILHPEKYAADEAPVAVDLPADLATQLGAGWSVPLEDTFGELQIGIWLRESGVAQGGRATAAAAGWGGDRLAVVEGPTAPGPSSSRRPGTRRPTPPSSPTRPTRRSRAWRSAARVSSPAGRRRRASLVASSDVALLALDAIVGGDRRLTRRPTARAGLHRLGRGDPEQAERVRQRDPRGARRARAAPRTAPARRRRRPARRGRRRGRSSRARSRRP